MNKRSKAPARVLAVLALIGGAVAIVVVVSASTRRRRATRDAISAAKQPERAASRASGSKPAPKAYVVQNGDTLSAIAQKTGVPVARIAAAEPRRRPADPDRRREAEAAVRLLRRGAGCRPPLAAAAARPRPRRRRRAAGAQGPAGPPPARGPGLGADRRPHRRGARLPRRRAAAADRQHDEADDRLRGAAGAAARQASSRAAPYDADPRRVAARPARRGSGSASATCSTG